MSNTILRAGILGAGGMGRRFAACLGKIEHAEVTAICTRTRGRAQSLNAEFCGGSASLYDDFAAMLDSEDLHILFVCLPPFAHSGQVEAAARRGIHLFLEKPIAIDVSRAESMVRAAEETGVVTQVGHHMRFLPAVQRVRELIDTGRAGKPVQYMASFLCNSLHTKWWRDKAKSGGQIVEQMIHMYDMARYMLGSAVSVAAIQSTLVHDGFSDYSVEDLSAAVVRFSSGAVASVSGSNSAIPGKWTGDVTLICERLTVKDMLGPKARLSLHNGPDCPDTVKEELIVNDTDPYLDETKRFVATVLGKEKPFLPIREGLEDLKLVASAVKAAETDAWVHID